MLAASVHLLSLREPYPAEFFHIIRSHFKKDQHREQNAIRLALASGLLLRLLEDLLDDLLLLDQESTDDTVLDATGAAGTTIGTADGLLGAGDLGVFTGAEGGNLSIAISILLMFAMVA
jgi:hypothetical protein